MAASLNALRALGLLLQLAALSRGDGPPGREGRAEAPDAVSDAGLELATLSLHLPGPVHVQVSAALAAFSGDVPDGGLERPLAFAQTEHGCHALPEFRGRSVGAIVVAHRGKCGFYEKAATLVSAGAAAVIVVNDRTELVTMEAKSAGLVSTRPVALVSNATGSLLHALVERHGRFNATLAEPPPPPPGLLSSLAHWGLWASGPLLCVAVARGAHAHRGALARSRDALLERITRRVNTKRLHRRLDIVGRALLVCTFAEDSARVLLRWRRQMRFMQLAFGRGAAGAALGSGVLAASTAVQLAAVGGLLLRRSERAACLALLAWTALHPALYGQLANARLLATSASVAGGLLLVLAEHSRADRGRPLPRAQLCGRVLATGALLHAAYAPLCDHLLHGHTAADFVAQTALEVGAAVGASLLCALVICGFKSRWSAAALVLALLVVNVVRHPFWALEVSTHADLVDEAQFFHFHTLSACGALGLLVLHGPGRNSIDEPAGPLPVVAVKAAE